MSLTRMIPLLVIDSSSLVLGDWLRSSAMSVFTRIMGLLMFLLPPRPLPFRVLRPLRPLRPLPPRRPPRLPPRPNFPLIPLPDDGGRLFPVSQPVGFCPISGSASKLVVGSTTTVRGNQPPRSRDRNIGLRAGADAVMSAKLVSMADVTKPVPVPWLEEAGKRPKSP